MSVITSSHSTTTNPFANFRDCLLMSNGSKVALIQPPTGSPTYSVSTDNGATWGTPATLPGTLPKLSDVFWSGAVLGSPDVCYLWYRGAAASGWDVSCLKLTWTAASNTLGSPVTTTFTPLNGGGLNLWADAVYDSSASLFHVIVADVNASPTRCLVFASNGTGTTATSPILSQAGGWKGAAIAVKSGSPATVFAGVGIPPQSQTMLWPLTWNGSAYQVGGGETVVGTPAWHWMSVDSSGNVDIIYESGTSLYATKRTGTLTYVAATEIAKGVGSLGLGYYSVARDPSQGDLYAYWTSVANQANGEIYLSWRKSGVWQQYTRVAGGDAGGYQRPSVSAALSSGNADLTYLTGTSSPLTLVYTAQGASSAPNAPVSVGPAGPVGTLTPTLVGQYVNNGAPNDGPNAVQDQVFANDGTTLIWDSGTVATSATNAAVTYGGTATNPPGSAPTTAALTAGGSIDAGSHVWAVTFTTASGETTAGPISAAQTATAPLAAPGAPTIAGSTTGGTLAAATYAYAVTATNANGETTIGTASSSYTATGTTSSVALSALPTPSGATGRKIYRTSNGGTSWGLVTTLTDNTTTTWTDTGAAAGAAPPAANTTGLQTEALAAIPTGPTSPVATTGRKIYRSKAGTTSPLYFVGTIADNTTTTLTDTLADAALGSQPPTSNGTGLQYGTTYQHRRRYRDSLTASGAGTWGPYSSQVAFTPYQAGTVTITKVIDNGTTSTASPVTLGAPNLDELDFSWSQAGSNAASQYRRTIYANDGVTVVCQDATWQTFTGGNLSSGSTYNSGGFVTAGLVNSTTYKLGVAVKDATSGLVSQSALWTLNTSWTPPPPVSGLTVTYSSIQGTVTLSWTNPGAAASVVVQRSPAGAGQWTTLKSGSLYTSLTDRPPLKTAYDYNVYVLNSQGIPSS